MKLALAALALAFVAGTAAAQPVDHAALGAEAFADGRLDEALRELEAAYREEPDPNLLFALGRVHSARGDCLRAVDHYRRYLDSLRERLARARGETSARLMALAGAARMPVVGFTIWTTAGKLARYAALGMAVAHW